MRLLWLADVLRDAGLTVHEVSGWRTRGSADFGPARGITCHHTAGSRTSSDEGELRVLLQGSTSAPAPIAQLYLSRSGEWWVVASGLCYHNLVGWAGPNRGYGNDSLIGIEAQHSGTEPWTDVQYRSYVRGVAALVRHLGIPVARVAGHKEHQPGSKFDPTFDMATFRRHVAAVLEAGEDTEDMPTIPEILAADVDPSTGKYSLGGAVFTTLERTGRIQNVIAPQISAQLAGLEAALARLAEAVAAGDSLTAEQLRDAVRAGVEAAGIRLDEQEIIEGVLAGLAGDDDLDALAELLRRMLPEPRRQELAAALTGPPAAAG